MNILRFLREQATNYDCRVCGQNHAKSEIRVLGRLDPAWIVRVTCTKCRTALKLLVVLDQDHAAVSPVHDDPVTAVRPQRKRRPAVTLDEVLDAHEVLRTFEGDVNSLFRARERVEAERDSTA